jgi:hypothetical protein
VTGLSFVARELRRRPIGTVAGLGLEYAGWVGGCIFVVALLATRIPLLALDRLAGTRVRERLIDAIARMSNG